MGSIAFTACAWYTTAHLGVDRHTWDVPISSFSQAALVSHAPSLIAHAQSTNKRQIAWILQVLMLVASGATKASVLLFYRRLVVGTLARRWKLAIYFALAFHAIYLVSITLGYLLICRPLQAYWMSYDYNWNQPYTCAPANGINPVIGVLSVLSDVYAVALPFVILHYYTLDVPRAQRIGLNIIFALGLLVAGAGIGRTYYLIKLGNTYDTSWTGFDLLIWTIIELQLGIICACAPSLRAFFRRYVSEALRKSFTSSKNKSRSGTHEGTQNSTALQRVPGPDKELQVLTRLSTDSERAEPSSEAPARSMSPAYTYQSREVKGGYSRTEPVRWNSNDRGTPWPTTQDISEAILRAQSTHSTV
jgi:hypothetical protein